MNKSFCGESIRLVTFLLIVSFFPLRAQSIMTGVVLLDGDPYPGCTVRIMQNNTTQITDVDGRFLMSAGDLKNLSLVISNEQYTCKVVIDEIPVGAARIELDTIPLFFNEEASVTEYNKFSSDKKKKYVPTYCWGQLIGYFNTKKCDTTLMWNALHVKRGITYRFDSLDNKVVIRYKDWKR